MERSGVSALFAAALSLSLASAAVADLYRWKNGDGNPVMSDRPPPAGTQYETIATNSSVARRVQGETPPAPAAPRPPPAPPAKKPVESARTVYEKNPEYCATARNNLEVMDRSARVRMPDEDGEMRYITGEERAAEREKNLEIVAIYCE